MPYQFETRLCEIPFLSEVFLYAAEMKIFLQANKCVVHFQKVSFLIRYY